VDKNLLPSDNVFGVLGRSPISQADTALLAAGDVYCNPTTLDTSYRLREMLVPSEADSIDKLLKRSRAFMFAHGMVTLGSTASDGKRRLVVPNKIADTVYFEHLQSVIGLREFDVDSLFDSPSSDKLQSFIQRVVVKVETRHDAAFSEGAFQAEVESFIRALLHVSPRSGLNLFVESSHDDGKGFSDMILYDEARNVVVVLELARARLNFLQKYFQQIRNPEISVGRETLIEWEQEVNDMTVEEVMELKWRQPEGHVTIRKALENKKQQAQKYVDSLERNGSFKTSTGEEITLAQNPAVSSFAIVQVGRRILVQDAAKS
jgi:hypothetical protein